jgi:hypothetical protein
MFFFFFSVDWRAYSRCDVALVMNDDDDFPLVPMPLTLRGTTVCAATIAAAVPLLFAPNLKGESIQS